MGHRQARVPHIVALDSADPELDVLEAEKPFIETAEGLEGVATHKEATAPAVCPSQVRGEPPEGL
jgi:hypothetical protein